MYAVEAVDLSGLSLCAAKNISSIPSPLKSCTITDPSPLVLGSSM